MLKAKVANKPILDNDGYCNGIIETVLEIEEREEKEGRKTIKYAAQFEIVIKSDGSHKPITYKIWVGQNLNVDKFTNDSGVTDYNRLTRLCLQLGLLKESDLKNLESLELPDLEKLEGSKIKFKLEPSRKNQTFQVPDINSILLIK